jgi:hypothetical protein
MGLIAYKGGWVRALKTTVHHWQFHNGVEPINPGSKWPMVPPRSWTCWVYPEDDREFEEWMAIHCPTADCTHRFNSGEPMYTVSISDDGECMLFKLKFGV